MSSLDHHNYCTGGFQPDDIVISGIAGRFPMCNNIGELSDALMSKKFLLERDTRRFEEYSNAGDRFFNSYGTVSDLDRFDSEFFGIPRSIANAMDPMLRKILEVSYESIVDAGYDPTYELKGANIGVYSAIINEDTKYLLFHSTETNSNFAHGFLRAMFANRISYTFDFRGPSYTVDSACSSSFVALCNAFDDIRDGRVEAALVVGGELCLYPILTFFYERSGIVSPTGTSKPFDSRADGIVRSEAISALFIQKASVARRAYGTILNVKHTSTGKVPEGIYVPSEKAETKLFLDVLHNSGLTPDDIDFVEGHGTGTSVGDPIELKALENVYCFEGRNRPLYLGSVKSSLGHSESAAGNSGIIKVLLAFESGTISPNIGYEYPNPNSKALVDGKIQVVTEPRPLTSPYVPVNCFGFGGSILSTILKRSPIQYPCESSISLLPRLILFPGTTESSIQKMFHFIRDNTDLKDEYFALLNKLPFTPMSWKPYRGYALYKCSEPRNHIKKILEKKREVWFVLTGMGCQWPGMGLEMMKIEAFAKSMRNSAKILKPLGIDLFEILKKDDKHLMTDRSITPAFVAIAAIQIALVDVLTDLQIYPDGIIGHSTGELVCAYADGSCSAEQTILSSYWRGKAVESSDLVIGAMAAVGLTWKEATERCPKDVYPACHNAEDSVTISGLKEPVENFVEELQKKNIFARTVNAYSFSFHCKNIWPASSKLRNALNKIIPNPRLRTNRWISTSYPEEELETDRCKFAGPEYFVHNLMSPVLFNEGLKKIPPNAITIEIGPHFLLQSILKRSIGPNASYIGLMKRNNDNNVEFFLESLGKLYIEGLDPKIEKLYPPVNFPVPRGTPVISNLVEWDYSETWNVPKWKQTSGSYQHPILLDDGDKYLRDHFIDGREIFPATGYVYLAWKALEKKCEKNFDDINIVVENFKIHRATILPKKGILIFEVQIQNGSKSFEIFEGNSLVSSGKVYEVNEPNFIESHPTVSKKSSTFLPGSEIYNQLKIYGYEYGPSFRRLVEGNQDGTEGYVEWNDWISFLDALMLFYMLSKNKSTFSLPTGALSFNICPSQMKISAEECVNQNLPGIPVNFYADTNICRSSGVEIRSLEVITATKHVKPSERIMEEYKFSPYFHRLETPDKDKKLQKYMLACNKLVEKMENKWKVSLKDGKFVVGHIRDFDVDTYIKDFTKDQIILGTLKDLAEKEKGCERDNDYFVNFTRKVVKDPINTLHFNEDSLRFMFDIIFENTFRKSSILELNNDFLVVLPGVVAAVEKFSLIKFKSKTLVCKREDDIDKEVVQKYNIHMLPYEKLISTGIENQNIVISSFSIGTKEEAYEHVHCLGSTLEEGGFVVLFHKMFILPPEILLASVVGEKINVVSDLVMEEIFETEKLVIVSKISDKLVGNLYLLRRSTTVKPNKLINMSETENWFDQLKSGILESSETVWLLSEDCPSSGLIGMVNCLRHEPGGDKIRCVFIPEKSKMKSIPPFSFSEPFFKNILQKDLLMNVFKDNAWGSFRHSQIDTDIQSVEVNNSFVNIKKFGDLSSLTWVESAVDYLDVPDESLVHIYYSSLNFKDVMLATGRIPVETSEVDEEPDNSVLGFEFSGRLNNGQRVAGICKSRGIATRSKILPEFTFTVPDDWSLEDAATVPVVYATCYYALIMRGRLKPRESILIHSGTGGVGLAAISIALSMNCEVFTTVGSEEKRNYLLETFPRLKNENIGCSRNTSFEIMILRRTKGKGVKMVLNSLSDDKFQASIRCIAKNGRFVEIGKYDLAMDHTIGLKVFLKNVNFLGVFLDQLMDVDECSQDDTKMLRILMEEGMRNGVIKPLRRTVFRRDEVEKAFRYMAAGKHIGKVLIKIRDEEKDKLAIPRLLRINALPMTYFYPHKVYIVVGGLGGFGIECSKWLLAKGARNLVLTSRYGARTPFHLMCLKRWKNRGFNVVVSTRDVSIKNEAKELLKDVSQIGPVGGIFNSAVVLHDGFLDKLSLKNFKDVCAPKADATENLDTLSRCFCPELDHFVCFSSMSCGRGNAGQMNYGYANSVMERICEKRQTAGLPGLAIQWGIIGDVGVVHRHMGEDAMISGVVAQRVKSCLDTLDMSIQLRKPIVSSYVLQYGNSGAAQKDILQELANIFGIKQSSEINTFRKFGEMGVDSMMGQEVKQLLESSLETTFTVQELLDLRIEDVKKMMEEHDSQKQHDSTSVAHVCTTSSSLPQSVFHIHPVEPLNAVQGGPPIFVMDIECSDLSQLRALANTLDQPAFALLWSKDTPKFNVKELANWYLEKIKATNSQEIHIVALSSASVLAFEMFIQNLKTDNNIQRLTILNGSSTLVKVASKEEATKESEVDMICEFVEKYIPVAQRKLKVQLLEATNFEQQVQIIVDEFVKTSSEVVDKTELSETVAFQLKKLRLLECYRPSMLLPKDILVVEDSAELLANDVAETQSLLSEICTGKISIQRIPGIKNFEEDSLKRFAALLKNRDS